ncbi:hypothetical protein DV738_g5243, partial [Chaetothyriales sp. CBS 135597]
MSIYVDDDEDYIPIVVNARGNRGGNRIYLSPPSSGHRPRAASQGAQAQPINLTERRRSRYDGDPLDDLPYHLRKQLDEAQRIKDADKEKKERRRSRFDADALDDLPYHLRKQLDEAQRIKDADKEKERAAAAEIEKQRWEADLKQRYTDERIDRVLREKRKDRNDNDHAWAIDLSRPTFIKVNRKFLSPVTLDHFSLPWEWDKNDTEYIVIKRYIDEDFQDVLFDHTRTLKLKEKKLLTSAYEKDVTIKLRPATHVYKERDQLFVVRKKTSPPSRSTSRGRRVPWFFT